MVIGWIFVVATECGTSDAISSALLAAEGNSTPDCIDDGGSPPCFELAGLVDIVAAVAATAAAVA